MKYLIQSPRSQEKNRSLRGPIRYVIHTAKKGEPRSGVLRAFSPSIKLNGLKDGALPWKFTVNRGAEEDGLSQGGLNSGFNSRFNNGFNGEVNSEYNSESSSGVGQHRPAGNPELTESRARIGTTPIKGAATKSGDGKPSRCWSGVNDGVKVQ
ncbi:hypothetical protein KQX54_013793 [Cotesia glomerata]|uniref:Uncharacterized protein n=1 Tax=Cotesia glomerata TaxID=32391 RepID=A0AAV7J7J9_COTGL|nr:hypothetical protein KQX54_013793 [Cotesia glomerata]